MKDQRTKLLGVLILVIQNLRKPEVLASALEGLGQRHVAYGVRQEHYPLVGTVLLETLADFLGDDWTPAYQDAWAQAYEAICSIMLERPTWLPQSERAMTKDSSDMREQENVKKSERTRNEQ
jgi:hemoglobin-like flavoprotein